MSNERPFQSQDQSTLQSNEWTDQFEERKQDHIRLSLDPVSQTESLSQLDRIELIHKALPELDFQKISLEQKLFGSELRVPLFVSSMTAGHQNAQVINQCLAQICAKRGWAMGVGSQRRELMDVSASREWEAVRSCAPNLLLMGNIGVSQLIQTPTEKIQRMVDSLHAQAMIVHTNPLQEVLQPEGSPQFRGGLDAIKRLASQLKVPVVVKETGCGFSKKMLKALVGSGIYAVDVSGLGGTHWGRVEGGRSEAGSLLSRASETFRNWGIPTVDSLLEARQLQLDFRVWGSGGVRSGLDAAKFLALGAEMVGFAKPVMEAALRGPEALNLAMEQWELELKIAMFCTGSAKISDLQLEGVWRQM